jgi:aromatic-L-amino-acid/L-tryptophan decarboxylase
VDALREHMRLARLFADWIEADPDFEMLAPRSLSVVVFRYTGDRGDVGDMGDMGDMGDRGAAAHGESHATTPTTASLDDVNSRLLDRVNASGEVFLSHTRVRGQYALRLAIGNLRTTEAHVRRAWELLTEGARTLG